MSAILQAHPYKSMTMYFDSHIPPLYIITLYFLQNTYLQYIEYYRHPYNRHTRLFLFRPQKSMKKLWFQREIFSVYTENQIPAIKFTRLMSVEIFNFLRRR